MARLRAAIRAGCKVRISYRDEAGRVSERVVWARTPFIMMTARSQKRFVDLARDEGATLFSAKPFVAADLAERIAAIKAAPPGTATASTDLS